MSSTSASVGAAVAATEQEPLWRGCMLRYFFNPLHGDLHAQRGERFITIAVKVVPGALQVGYALKADSDRPDKNKGRWVAAARATYAHQRASVYEGGNSLVIPVSATSTLNGLAQEIVEGIPAMIEEMFTRRNEKLRDGVADLLRHPGAMISALARDLSFYLRRHVATLGVEVK